MCLRTDLHRNSVESHGDNDQTSSGAEETGDGLVINGIAEIKPTFKMLRKSNYNASKLKRPRQGNACKCSKGGHQRINLTSSKKKLPIGEESNTV